MEVPVLMLLLLVLVSVAVAVLVPERLWQPGCGGIRTRPIFAM